MPWTVQVEDEDGVLQSDTRSTVEFSLIFSMPQFELLPLAAASSLLKYLDPWGDTIFNRLQMNDLRAEWCSLTPTEQEAPSWNAVTEMIDRCSAGVHLYLHFIGD